MLHFVRRGRQHVWIVATRTTHFPLRGNRALAVPQLLDLAHRFLRRCVALHEDRLKRLERETRAKIEHVSPSADDAAFPLQVALLANRIAEARLEMLGVDDTRIGNDRWLERELLVDMQFARPVATFATDRRLHAESRLHVSIDRPRNVLHPVDVAIKATRLNRSSPVCSRLESGRDVPNLTLGKPTDPRLPDGTFAKAEIRLSQLAGPDDDLGVGTHRNRRLAIASGERLDMNDLVGNRFDPILAIRRRCKSRSRFGIVAVVELRIRANHGRTAHRVLVKTLVNLDVASRARRIADVFHARFHVSERRGERELRVFGGGFIECERGNGIGMQARPIAIRNRTSHEEDGEGKYEKSGMRCFQITITRRDFTAPSLWDEVVGGVGLRFRDGPSSRNTP